MNTSFDQGQNWFLRGMRAGIEARKQHPEWDEQNVVYQSGIKAVAFLLVDPDGAVAYSNGFIKGFKAVEA